EEMMSGAVTTRVSQVTGAGILSLVAREFGLCLPYRGPVTQPAHDLKTPPIPSVFVAMKRHPQSPKLMELGKAPAFSHSPDYGCRLSVETQRFSQDARLARE